VSEGYSETQILRPPNHSSIRVCLCTFLISFTNESHWPPAISPAFPQLFPAFPSFVGAYVDFWQRTRHHKGIKWATSERVLGQIEWAFKCIGPETEKSPVAFNAISYRTCLPPEWLNIWLKCKSRNGHLFTYVFNWSGSRRKRAIDVWASIVY